jgi:hypothetical protein
LPRRQEIGSGAEHYGWQFSNSTSRLYGGEMERTFYELENIFNSSHHLFMLDRVC